jgi:small subunit ribosomal protein S3Ae
MPKKQIKLKKKKKKWYSILAPVSFGKKEIGEAYVSAPSNLIGKKVRINLYSLARTRNSNIRITFEVKGIEEEKGMTELISYELLFGYIKRIVKKNRSKINISEKIKSKDGLLLTKYIIITKNKVQRGILTTINKKAKELFAEYFKDKPSDKIFDNVINYAVQKEMRDKLKKIYPLSNVEIRFLKKIEEKKEE